MKNRALEPSLRERHYVLHSPKHPRRWVAFSPKKVESYRKRFGDDFCLVITGDPLSPNDFYVFPWPYVAQYFTTENLFPFRQKNGTTGHRWQLHLEGAPHRFQMELAPSDPRERPSIPAEKWYGNESVLVQATTDHHELERRVQNLRRLPSLARPTGEAVPAKHTTETKTVYERRPDVKAWVLREADGRCELCQQEAPFVGDDGEPFLEVHHIQQLAEGGPDIVENAAALCPNCHRRLHNGQDRAEQRDRLYRQVSRLLRHAHTIGE